MTEEMRRRHCAHRTNRPESRTQVVEMTEEIATEAAKLRSVARVVMTTLLCAALLAVQRRITHPFSTKGVGY